MENTLVSQVFETLKKEGALIDEDKGPIKTQSDFAKALEITGGYMSMLLKQSAEAELSPQIRTKLNTKYNISMLWLMTKGTQGAMREGAVPQDNSTQKSKLKSSKPEPVPLNEMEAIRDLLGMLKNSMDNVQRLTISVERLTKENEQLRGKK